MAKYDSRAAQNGTHEHLGYPNSAYGTSKAGLNALTRIFQREFNKDPRPDIIVNALCPGYDMTSHKGFLTPEQGNFFKQISNLISQK